MARLFTITSASDTLPLELGRGEITFTVSNAAGRPLRARARAVALGETKPEWLSVGGESERDFSSEGTQQFAVRVSAPETTTPGKYPFRLDVVSVVNPDEDFTEGPPVTALVGAAAIPPPTKSIPWWIVPVVAGVLIVGGLLTWLALRDDGPPANANQAANASTPTPAPTMGLADSGPPILVEVATPTPTFAVQYVTLSANPNYHNGKCPADVEFTATFTANGPGVIQFQVLGSYTFPGQAVTVPAGGVVTEKWTHKLPINWTPFGPGPPWTAGAKELVQVTSPNNVQSNLVGVSMLCQP